MPPMKIWSLRHSEIVSRAMLQELDDMLIRSFAIGATAITYTLLLLEYKSSGTTGFTSAGLDGYHLQRQNSLLLSALHA